MKFMLLTLRIVGALGLLGRGLVVLLSICCLLYLLSFPAFSHFLCSLADLKVFFVNLKL